MDHYIGPGIITKYVGTRSMVITLNGREFQRDAGMIMLEKPRIMDDRIEVNYYTTITPALAHYKDASAKERSKNIKAATFLRTWCLDKGTGLPTTTPPLINHGKLNHLWWGRIPMEDVDKHILVRALGLSALGKLDSTTIKIAAQLDIPYHECRSRRC